MNATDQAKPAPLDRLIDALAATEGALRSFVDGNTSPNLGACAAICDHALSVLDEARRVAERPDGRARRAAGVVKYLDCSTGHLRPETRERLPDNAVPGLFCYPNDYGAWVAVPFDEDDDAILSADVLAVVECARKRGCQWIKFDCDGTEIPGLPTYPDTYAKE